MHVHIRREFQAKVRIDDAELFRILTDAAKAHLKKEGIAYPSDAEFRLRPEQEKEGSPSYSNGKWNVEVLITSDRMPEDVRVESNDK